MTRDEATVMLRKYYLETGPILWSATKHYRIGCSLLSFPNGMELFWDDKIYRVGHGCGDGPDGFQSQQRKHIFDNGFTMMVPQIK